MKNLNIIPLILIVLLSSSFTINETIDRDVVLLTKVLEIKSVQKILKKNDKVIITNGLISNNIQLFLDDQLLVLQEANDSGNESLVIEKFEVSDSKAKIIISNIKTKMKIKLVNEENEWRVISYFLRDGKSKSFSLEF